MKVHPAFALRARSAGRPVHRDAVLWVTAGLLAVLAGLTANPLLTAAAILVVPLFVRLLWRAEEPPVLLFLVMFQWLQVAVRVFHADSLGVPVRALSVAPEDDVELAIALGLAALLVLALAHRVMLTRLPPPPPGTLERERAALDPARVFVLFAVLFVYGRLAERWGGSYSSVSQLLQAVEMAKWVPLFMLGHLTASEGRGKGWLGLAVAAEVVLGLSGYFSGFKTVFFVLIVAALAASRRLSRQQWAVAVAAGCVVLGLSVVWQGIKGHYRLFLSQGERAQVVLVPWQDRMAHVVMLAGDLTAADLGPAMEEGFLRLAYVDNFAAALAHVPGQVPHADGAIWGAAVKHVLAPRFLFPNKARLVSDSELTMRYTGRRFASGEQGTSISLGYVPESYVDFGLTRMWLPILLMGLLQGWSYVYLVRRAPMRLMGYGFATAAILPGLLFETAAVKYLGGTLYVLLTFVLLVRFCAGPVARWLVRHREAPRAMPAQPVHV